MKETYFENINKCLALIEKSENMLKKAYTDRDRANNLHWSLADIDKKSEKHNVYLESQELYKNSNEASTLWEIVKKASTVCAMQNAVNALIENMKENPDYWTKTPLHYKKFNSMLNDFFKPYEKTYPNGNTSNFKLDINYCRLSLVNYQYLHDYNTQQLVYMDKDGEKLTNADIEKMRYYDTIEPAVIVSTCKKAIKDAEKMKKMYSNAYAKISAVKKQYDNNYAIYYSMPSMHSYMDK